MRGEGGELINQGQDMTRILYLFHQGVEFAVVKPVHGQMPFLTAPAPSLLIPGVVGA